MKELKLFNIKNPILRLKTLLDGNLAIIDTENTLRIISSENYATLGGFKANIHHERLNGEHVDISLDGNFSASILPGTNKVAVFKVSDKKPLFKIGRHTGEIESVAFDPKSRYCITCGQDGKTFGWVLNTSRMGFSVPPHNDFISTVSFNDTAQWIATGSYDRVIHVLNLGTMKQPLKLRGHGSVIVKILFLPDAKLLSVERSGDLIVWDIHHGKVEKRLKKMNDDITDMVISDDKRFVFVSTKLGYIGLYDMHTFESVTQRYIKVSDTITSMAFLHNPPRLAVGTSTGDVRIYSLYGDEENYLAMLREADYRSFYDAVELNPLLMYSEPYITAEKTWSEIVEQARRHLENHERDKAKKVFEPFSLVSKKNAFIVQMLRDYEKYAQFKMNVDEERYSLAYSLANQYKSFQESEPYRQMQSRWTKAFTKAQEVIGSSGGEEKARAILSPFRGISEKTVLIQQLFEERRAFEYFKKVLAQNDYLKMFELIKRYPFLKEFAEYTAVMEYAHKLYIQTNVKYHTEEFAAARNGYEILSAFPDYAAEAKEMLESITIKSLFYEAIAADNLNSAYSYLNMHPFLYETPEALALEVQWQSVVDEAQHYAAKGLALKTLGVFTPYLNIHEKYAVIAGIMAEAYCVQLEEKIKHKAPQNIIEEGIRRYVKLFGVEEEIEEVFTIFKRNYATSMELKNLPQGSMDSWLPIYRIEDITAG